MLEEMDSTRLAAHIRYLAAAPAAVGLEFLRVFFGEFVLEGTGQSDVAWNGPCLLARCKDTLFRELIRHVLYFVAVRRTHDKHVVNHRFGDAIFDRHYAVGTGDRHYLSAQLNGFRRRTPCYVSEAGDSYFLAFDIFAGLMQQMLREIECAETGCLGTKD